jgi:GntR family transcriptional repressor for pyruvate dehydrogenase complex
MLNENEKKLSHIIAYKIQKLIIEGKYKKGDQLPPEREMANYFNVSRNTLREAISALSIMGVITKVQGGGNIISADGENNLYMTISLFFKIQEGNPYDVLFFRYILETQIVKILCNSHENFNFSVLNNIVEETNQTDDPDDLLELDIKFHKTLLNSYPNKLVSYLTDAIFLLIREQMKMTYDFLRLKKSLRKEIYENHRKMLDAIMNNDIKTAVFEITDGFESSYPALDFSEVKYCK